VSSLIKQEGDKAKEENFEEIVKKLVKFVRDSDNDMVARAAFSRLRGYVGSYIKLFSRKYKIPGHDEDEIEQECLYALRYKAIEDFDPNRGKFRTFATLCIRRHLYSLIKGSNQQKRIIQNKAVSLHDNWSENDDDDLSLINLVVNDDLSVSDQIEKDEVIHLQKQRLMSKLSELEQDVLRLYLQKYHYDEIVEKLKSKFPNKNMNKKVVDNSLVRCRQKAHELRSSNNFFDL